MPILDNHSGRANRLRHLCHSSAFFLLLLATTGCLKPPPPPVYHPMGERAQMGTFSVIASETIWSNGFGEGPAARSPANRFLAVKLTIVNSGANETLVPGFRLLDSSGKSYEEVQDGQGFPGWIGSLRKVKPADTLDGVVLFDVTPHSYDLAMEEESGQMSLVRITLPLRFTPDAPGKVERIVPHRTEVPAR